jgi:hypothetical protein
MRARPVASIAIGITLLASPALAETVPCPSTTYFATAISPPKAKLGNKPVQAHRRHRAKRHVAHAARAHPVKRRKTMAAKSSPPKIAAGPQARQHIAATPPAYRIEKKIETIACQAVTPITASPPESIAANSPPGYEALSGPPGLTPAGGFAMASGAWFGGGGGGGRPTVTPVPEPGVWTLMIGGMFGVGAQLRRNRARLRAVSDAEADKA